MAARKDIREKHKDVKPEDMKPEEQHELRKLASRARLTPAPMMQMEAMLLLPDKQAAAITLVGIYGYSYREAASKMEMHFATLQYHLNTGREALKTILARPNVTS